MKGLKILTFMVATMLVIGLAAMGAQVKIDGSKHDFEGLTWNQNGGICGPCHTPHNALSSVAPLWSHTNTAASFTMYTNVTMNAAQPTEPNPVSLMCLSCHDGTIALDAFVGETAGATATMPVGSQVGAGANLGTEHPISILYDTNLVTADGALKAPPANLLNGGYVECSSCHDAHGGEENTKLLRMANSNSELCLTCHDK